MLVQLGYFSTGSVANNFSGTFTRLTTGTRFGDSADLSGEGVGRIGFQAFFTSGSSTVNIFDSALDAGAYTTIAAGAISGTVPPPDQVLAIRFFDTTNGATGFFNTVSADTWLWKAPTAVGSTVTINLGSSVLEWQDSAHPFQTLIIVPEPSPSLLLIAAFGSLMSALRPRQLSRSMTISPQGSAVHKPDSRGSFRNLVE